LRAQLRPRRFGGSGRCGPDRTMHAAIPDMFGAGSRVAGLAVLPSGHFGRDYRDQVHAKQRGRRMNLRGVDEAEESLYWQTKPSVGARTDGR
jgi:hypothetical protein